MLKRVEKYIEAHQMLKKGDIVVVGVSGGADSMCLLFVLEKVKKNIGFEIIVVHVNHMLRAEAADREEEYVKTFCEKQGIPFEAYRSDVKEYAKQEKMSEEEAGRAIRRIVFEKTAEKYGATKIALAHHMDDNAETFLLHLSRGSKLGGLGGMKPVNGKYIRPFLEVRRDEIEKYLEEEKIAYFVDQTNLEDKYTRNRIRNHVVPYLCEYVNAQSVEHINASMKYFRKVQEYLDRQVETLWKDVASIEQKKGVLNAKLWQQDEIIRTMLIRQMLIKLAGREKDIEERHVKSVDELWIKQTGRRIDLPYQMCAVRRYEEIEVRIRENEENKQLNEVVLPLEVNQSICVSFGEFWVNCKVFKKTKERSFVPKKTFTKWFDYDIIEKNVSIRTKKQGDKLVIDRKGNVQKLKKYFVNEKIPADERTRIPIIAEDDQVLWVVGYRQSIAYQVTETTTTILEIEINGGEEDGRSN